MQQIFVKIAPITQALKKHSKKEIPSSEAPNTTWRKTAPLSEHEENTMTKPTTRKTNYLNEHSLPQELRKNSNYKEVEGEVVHNVEEEKKAWFPTQDQNTYSAKE